MQKIIGFVKKETILTIAWAAAAVSGLFVHPSAAYLGYIDFKSLGILWSLMVVMEGFKQIGFFDDVGRSLLAKTRKMWQLEAVLVFLCFFFSMLITNDVALLTFVPFTIFIMGRLERTELLIPIIALQTLAANLGSMLTPVGNPQNLYLYSLSGMSFGEFTGLMLPYTGLTFALLVISISFHAGKSGGGIPEDAAGEKVSIGDFANFKVAAYAILFIIALMVVLRIIPFTLLCAIVLVTVFFMDRKVLFSIDYALLFTFVGFFIFTGNLGNIPSINSFLTAMVSGREVPVGVLASQFISNVPAALLLSEFTEDFKSLIIGVNLGGLGTLIASMASLISFKSLAHNYNALKGRYFLHFTLMNIIYLAILMGLWILIG